jgi:trehalose 6-phosphate synthase
MSLIVVSNRVARPKGDEPIEGGLAAALLPAVKTSGAIWVGASTRLLDSSAREPFAEIEALGAGAVATVDLPKSHYRGFYEGFANGALWPVLHSRADLIQTTAEEYASYRTINAYMARALLRFAKPDSLFWIHDYHFLPLACELRQLGIRQAVGFFLHTPFPNRRVIAGLSNHRELVRAMLAYDLIGFQTEADRANFADYLQSEFGLRLFGDVVTTERGATRLASFPIGIDVAAFADRAAKAAARPEIARLRSSLQHATLAIGVDRVDYSKGLINRLQAFDRMLQLTPSLKREVSLLQIAVPSRTQIDAYRQLRAELAALVGEINGRHGEVDWTPIRYLNKGFAQSTLAGFYRTARIGLVTSLQDGMNLVAKEYVAAQNPADPGMLVLSKFAGAAQQLDTALLVNPHDIDGLARAIAQGFAMPLEERRERWQAMMQKLEASSLETWFRDFADALAARRPTLDGTAPVALRPAAPRRFELTAAPNH